MEIHSRNNILLVVVSCGEFTCVADLLEDAMPEDLPYSKDAPGR